jgi:hypothetical protein
MQGTPRLLQYRDSVDRAARPLTDGNRFRLSSKLNIDVNRP